MVKSKKKAVGAAEVQIASNGEFKVENNVSNANLVVFYLHGIIKE